jgi:hypothetical protein
LLRTRTEEEPLPRQTSKGGRHTRRESRLTQKATHRHQYIGDSEAERAESEYQKFEHLKAERKKDSDRERAAEMRSLKAQSELRIPRSIDEGRKLIADTRELAAQRLDEGRKIAAQRIDEGRKIAAQRIDEGKRFVSGAPQALREKAEARLEALPKPAKKLLARAQATAGLLFLPARLGMRFLHDLAHLPGALIHALRRQEA